MRGNQTGWGEKNSCKISVMPHFLASIMSTLVYLRMQGADSPNKTLFISEKKSAHGACVTTRVLKIQSSTYLHLRSWIYVETKRRTRSKTRLFVYVT